MIGSAKSKTAKSSASARNTEGYSLKNKAPLTPKPNTSDTKPPVLRQNKMNCSSPPAGTETASNFVNSVCKGAELVRNLNLFLTNSFKEIKCARFCGTVR